MPLNYVIQELSEVPEEYEMSCESRIDDSTVEPLPLTSECRSVDQSDYGNEPNSQQDDHEVRRDDDNTDIINDSSIDSITQS